jgi:hypothetical protein
VHVGQDADGNLISIVDAKPCPFLVSEKKPAAAQSGGIIRFFDTADGKWECPDCKGAGHSTAARQ